MLSKVVDKIQVDRAKCILIMPNWPTQSWFQDAHRMARKKIFYHAGSHIFDVDQGKVGGVRWGVWAMYLDGSRPESPGRRASAPESDGKSALVQNFWLNPPKPLFVNSMSFRGGELQLVLLIPACLPDGSESKLRILVDTGALVKMGLVPEKLMQISGDPVTLRMANGQR